MPERDPAEDLALSTVTPPLAEFRERYEDDDNIWWVIGCGHHMNLFDAACDEIDRLLERLAECGERFDAEHEHVLNLTDEVARLRAQLLRPTAVGRIEAQHAVFTRQLLGDEDG